MLKFGGFSPYTSFFLYPDNGSRRRPKHVGADNKKTYITASVFVCFHTWMKDWCAVCYSEIHCWKSQQKHMRNVENLERKLQ
jgi:hypothetical protein